MDSLPALPGVHILCRDEWGKELCVACELCSKICPTDCITVIPMEDDTGRGIADRVPRVWDVDLAMPEGQLIAVVGREYEFASFDLESAVLHVDELLIPQPVPESFKGGVHAKTSFIKSKDGIKVEADLSRTKKRKL